MTAAPSNRRRRIAVATCDTLTTRMAGPAIRAWHMAAALAAEHEVQLVSTSRADVSSPLFRIEYVDDKGLKEVERWCDVFVFQGWVLHGRPFLLNSEKIVVADVYDPLHLEQLEQARDEGARGRVHAVDSAAAVLNEQLLRGDYFLCATESQRDFWLGHLAALGRINPLTYDDDPTLRSLIGVAPFGISDAKPVKTRNAVKGVLPGIGPYDKLLLWGGGIYNWFDPLTLIRAVDRLRHRLPEARLLFMGIRHPNAEIPTMSMAIAARRLADELELTGRYVFFNEGWVDYEDRQNYLLDADVGVSTHLDCIESAMSYRTRVLDYFWATLPVVTTSGDALAGMVEQRELGLTVPPGDVERLETALFRALSDDGRRRSWQRNVEALRPELAWSRAMAPLVEFCRAPRRAPDLVHAGMVGRPKPMALDIPYRWKGWRHDVRIGIEYLRTGGPTLLARKAWSRMRKVLWLGSMTSETEGSRR